MTTETIVAILIVFCLFVAGALYAVNLAWNKFKTLLKFECECDGDELHIQEDEDAAKVKKHQELRLLAKKIAADKFYATLGGAEMNENRHIDHAAFRKSVNVHRKLKEMGYDDIFEALEDLKKYRDDDDSKMGLKDGQNKI